MTTSYSRSTLIDRDGGARLTCDVDLAFCDDVHRKSGGDMVIVESKNTGSTSPADRALGSMGIRAVSMSKYCVGLALLHPRLPANRWSRTLRHEFGWERELPAA